MATHHRRLATGRRVVNHELPVLCAAVSAAHGFADLDPAPFNGRLDVSLFAPFFLPPAVHTAENPFDLEDAPEEDLEAEEFKESPPTGPATLLLGRLAVVYNCLLPVRQRAIAWVDA